MKRVLALLISGFLFSASIVLSEPLKKLPELTLASASGQVLTDTQLPVAGKWLLIYLSGDEKSDRNLLNLLQGLQEPVTGEKVTLVVSGANPGQLENLIKKNEKLVMFRWLGDVDRSAAKALQIAGSSTIMGMNGVNIEWVVGGTGKDKKVLRSQLVDWLR